MLCDWDGFCNKYKVLLNGVHLFKLKEDGSVDNHDYGRNKRRVLLRSDEMKTLVIKQAELVIRDSKDSNNKYCGLIYIMYRKKDSQIIPLYIGKCGKLGRGENLNTNLKNISRNEQYFCRWGNDYYRHIGGLSAATLCGYSKEKITKKYKDWAEILFNCKIPTNTPKERESTYFWILACEKELLKDYEAKSLSAFESKLIESSKPLLNVRKK